MKSVTIALHQLLPLTIKLLHGVNSKMKEESENQRGSMAPLHHTSEVDSLQSTSRDRSIMCSGIVDILLSHILNQSIKDLQNLVAVVTLSQERGENLLGHDVKKRVRNCVLCECLYRGASHSPLLLLKRRNQNARSVELCSATLIVP